MFNHNGHIDYNDWVYESLRTKKRYRLLAHPPTLDNAFGFAPVDVDLNGTKVAGYFKRINFKGDDPRYSWIYLKKERQEDLQTDGQRKRLLRLFRSRGRWLCRSA